MSPLETSSVREGDCFLGVQWPKSADRFDKRSERRIKIAHFWTCARSLLQAGGACAMTF
jgi:hypothetical protein